MIGTPEGEHVDEKSLQVQFVPSKHAQPRARNLGKESTDSAFAGSSRAVARRCADTSDAGQGVVRTMRRAKMSPKASDFQPLLQCWATAWSPLDVRNTA